MLRTSRCSSASATVYPKIAAAASLKMITFPFRSAAITPSTALVIRLRSSAFARWSCSSTRVRGGRSSSMVTTASTASSASRGYANRQLAFSTPEISPLR